MGNKYYDKDWFKKNHLNSWPQTGRSLHDIWQIDKDELIKRAKKDVMEKIKSEYSGKQRDESDEDKVIRILKKDFEAKHGMSFDKFIETYNKILANNPEKLI